MDRRFFLTLAGGLLTRNVDRRPQTITEGPMTKKTKKKLAH